MYRIPEPPLEPPDDYYDDEDWSEFEDEEYTDMVERQKIKWMKQFSNDLHPRAKYRRQFHY